MRSSGNEDLFFGATNGHVMQLEKGSSFDGSNIESYLTLNWNVVSSPRIRKRFRKAAVLVQGNFYAAFNFGYLLSYGSALVSQPNQAAYASGFVTAPVWDSFTWDQFIWDGQTLLPTELGLAGTAESIQMSFSTSTNYIQPFTISNLMLQYSPRRGMR